MEAAGAEAPAREEVDTLLRAVSRCTLYTYILYIISLVIFAERRRAQTRAIAALAAIGRVDRVELAAIDAAFAHLPRLETTPFITSIHTVLTLHLL